GVSGWGGDGEFIWGAGVGPSAVFFALVTASTQSGGIGPTGSPSVSPTDAMIRFLERAVTPWGGTGVLTNFQHLGQPVGEAAGSGVHGHQLPIGGPGVEPAEKLCRVGIS